LQATKKVALLAQRMKQLRGFVHISTAYVNSNLPRGSHVEEKVYPIYRKNGQILDPDGLARTLTALSPAAAELKVQHQHARTTASHICTCDA
jgi:fatty acyl-CoA reductase